MTSINDRMEEEIRTILASGEEATHGWSDQQVIAEARKRAGIDGKTADAPDDMAMDRWEAMIAELRSETDNDGQTRSERRV